MSDTIRIGNTRDGRAYEAGNRRSVHNTEVAWARRLTNRTARHATRLALATTTDFDDLTTPRRPATSGWITH